MITAAFLVIGGAESGVGFGLLWPRGGALRFVVVVGGCGRLAIVAWVLCRGCCSDPGSASVGGRVGWAAAGLGVMGGGLSLGLVSTQFLQLLNIS